MKSLLKLGCVYISASLLLGCATTGQQGVTGTAVQEPVAESSGPVLPNVELTEALLDDMLVAEVAVQRGQYEAAVEKYHSLALQTRDPRVVERATRIALFARDYKKALELSRLWIELDPANVDASQFLTSLLLREGDYDGALVSLEKVLAAVDLAEQDRYLLLIRLLGREPDKQAALTVLERLQESHPDDPAVLYAYAQLALRANMLEQAEQSVAKLLEQKKDWPQAVILKTRILQATQREAEAVTYLGEVVGRNGRNLELRVAYGRLLVDEGRPQEALQQFRKVLKSEPENDDILFAAGLVALRAEEYDEAYKYFYNLFERSVRLDESTYYLGRIAELHEDDKEAIHWYAKVSGGDNYLNAQIRSALLIARQGDVEAARAHLHAAKARNPSQKLRLYLAEGEILRDIKHYAEALEVYDNALEEEPNNIELLYARAMVAERLGKVDVLEHDLMAILEREPDHVDALNSLGYTLADRTDRLDEAYDYVKRALDLSPDSFYILDSMGWVYFRQGKLDQAIEYLQKAMSMSDDAEVAAHLGEVLWAKGDQKQASAIWRKALKAHPENDALLDVIKRFEKQ